MRLGLILSFCLLLPVQTEAQALPDVIDPAIASLTAGVVCGPPVIGSIPAPGTLAGSTHIIAEDPPFIAEIRQVPAVTGIGFGIKALAADAGGLSFVTMTVTHPPMGARGVTTQSYSTQISGLSPSLTFYQFDEEFEKVPGLWTFTATRDGAVLYQISFDVVPPALLPDLAEACGYRDLLS